ncbi:hypothetical protein PRJ_1617 [Pseudomonas sp. XWY-1]|nr:hypothetical protein PRJ_1617 [Pseudomonas sp. XWY-1]
MGCFPKRDSACAGLFAGKPAPTTGADRARSPVGAGLPAKRPAQAEA